MLFRSDHAMHAQTHRSDPRILDRRTLQRDHRLLAALLRPGMAVLDVGCGTGAITAGIANAVGDSGYVVGVDRDDALLELARAAHGAIANLRFEHADATELSYSGEFNVVTAARALQWMSRPEAAIAKMKQAAKPGGMLVVLDYNHRANAWRPDPPPEFLRFYSAFLAWRDANGWDNDIADHLPALLRDAGLIDIETYSQDEVAERGDPDFAERTAIWLQVIESVGPNVADGGFCSVPELHAALDAYTPWVKNQLVKQTLVMRAVTGMAIDRRRPT